MIELDHYPQPMDAGSRNTPMPDLDLHPKGVPYAEHGQRFVGGSPTKQEVVHLGAHGYSTPLATNCIKICVKTRLRLSKVKTIGLSLSVCSEIMTIVVVVVDPLLPDYWGESASVV